MRRFVSLSPRRLLLSGGVRLGLAGRLGLGLASGLGLRRAIRLRLPGGCLLLGLLGLTRLARRISLLRGVGPGLAASFRLGRTIRLRLSLGGLLLRELGLMRLASCIRLLCSRGPGLAAGVGLGRTIRLSLPLGALLLGELGLACGVRLLAGALRCVGLGLHVRCGLGSPRCVLLLLRLPLGLDLALPGLTTGRSGRQRGVGRRRPHAAARRSGVDHRRDAGAVGNPRGPLAIPGGGFFSLVLVAPVAPGGFAGLLGLPGLLLGDHLRAPFAPGLGIGLLTPLMHRRVVERPGAGQVARGAIGRVGVVVGRPSVGEIDRRQLTLVVAVGVLRIADQEWLVGASIEIVGAIAVRRWLDHPVFALVRPPDPRAHALIVDGVVGRAVGEGLAERIGAIDVAVPLPRGRRGVAHWRLRRQGRDRRGGDHRRRRALSQGKARGRRTSDQVRGALAGVPVACGEAEAGDRQ